MEASDSEVNYTEEYKSGEASSVGECEEGGNKRFKLEEKQDRISALPDSLIQRILSFLPSTKEAIQTSILSKRWQNQWSYVPVLVFDFGDQEKAENVARFIDNTLHLYNCSKMKKFHINYKFDRDANFTSKVHFVARKDVEELILDRNRRCSCCLHHPKVYALPKFIFDNASLVRLEILDCDFQPSWRINWLSLRVLKICSRTLCKNQAIENVLLGSPSLESLEIIGIPWWESNLVKFASTSLKILILVDISFECAIEFSCPNLVQLFIGVENWLGHDYLPAEVIKEFVSGSPLLHTFELDDCYFDDVAVIASKSLKRVSVVLTGWHEADSAVGISCPNLEELKLYDLDIEKCKFKELSSSCCANLSTGGVW